MSSGRFSLLVRRLNETVLGYARRDGDAEHVQLEKATILLVAASCCLCGCVWSAMYLVIFGLGLPMALPLAFVVIVGAAIIISARLGDHRWLVYAQLFCITWISAFIEWSIGGFSDAGIVITWSFLGPIGALMFLSLRQAAGWMVMFLTIVALSAGLDERLSTSALHVSQVARTLFFAMNLGGPTIVVFIAAAYFVKTTQRERARSDGLLLNILPAAIARRLKDENAVIADAHENVSVLFADIVNFTSYSATIGPEQLVSRLNRVFRHFDELTRRHGLEKIKTIGDAYMVTAGLPEAHADHAAAIADLALDMRDALADLDPGDDVRLALRIGIHCGPVVAGVIGTSKFAYDLWGDTVNTASRMESYSLPGRIQVTQATSDLLGDRYNLEDRGEVEVKGKGIMRLYFLLGRADKTDGAAMSTTVGEASAAGNLASP